MQIDVSGTFMLPVPPVDAFPMFDPVREAEWAEGWHIDAVHPIRFQLQRDATFEVPGPNGVREVWTVVDVDPDACRVEYLAVAANDLVRRVTVQCDPADAGTRVTVRYVVTAWSPAGVARAAGYDRAFIEAWRGPVVEALMRARGPRLRATPAR